MSNTANHEARAKKQGIKLIALRWFEVPESFIRPSREHMQLIRIPHLLDLGKQTEKRKTDE